MAKEREGGEKVSSYRRGGVSTSVSFSDGSPSHYLKSEGRGRGKACGDILEAWKGGEGGSGCLPFFSKTEKEGETDTFSFLLFRTRSFSPPLFGLTGVAKGGVFEAAFS